MSSPEARPNAFIPWIASLAVHAGIAAVMGFAFYHSGALIAGSAGLSGATQTRSSMVVTMEEITAPPVKRALPVREGLPTEVKAVARENEEKPTEVQTETPTETSAVGNSDAGPEGSPGQGGSTNTAAPQIGSGDRSNEFGLYIAKIHRKVQAELRTPGYLPEARKAMIQVVIEAAGNVSEISVHQSSGERRLDLIAIDAVKRAQPFDPWKENLTVIFPVNFKSSN